MSKGRSEWKPTDVLSALVLLVESPEPVTDPCPLRKLVEGGVARFVLNTSPSMTPHSDGFSRTGVKNVPVDEA